MFRLFTSIITSLLLLIAPVAQAQTVGVVLSGGGATALAHIGFLKVLEENNIPIDFIGGTSMGAVIAAMYASGYSVAEIDSVVHSQEFELMAAGELDDRMKYYFLQNREDASMARIKYGKGDFIASALPTNLINPVLMDWKFMEGFSQADAAANYDFDSLFIPFRCIAADVEHKREVVFENGALNIAVRASSTYPFYLPPRRVDGALLFDGGLYDNFPMELMYREFLPDVIIGCNVSGEVVGPNEDDIFSQLQSMILFRDKQSQLCEQMVVVEPSVQNIGTFEFEYMNEAIAEGYRATMESMEKMTSLIDRRVTIEEKTAQRLAFRKKFAPFIVDDVNITGLERSQRSYLNKLMGRKKGETSILQLKEPYFRIFADEKIKSIFPHANYKPATGKFTLNLEVQREKDLLISFGGLFSSRSINTGYVGLRYNLFGKSAVTLSANSYFGRFYASIHTAARWDISSKWLPFSIEASFTQNRWDFYKSLSTFFEDVVPSFVLMNERFGNLAVSIPAGNKGVIRAEAAYTYNFDQYYQTRQFLSVDTADQTDFDAGVFRLVWERNTLNQKQFATKGTFLNISAKYLLGVENTYPGSTSEIRDTTTTDHQWIIGKIQYTNYFFRKGRFHAGLNLEGVASTQAFFNNYISSAIAAPVYQPIPESRTYFLPQFRAHNYVAGGLIGVFEISRNIDLRAEAYVFNAFGRILADNDLRARYDYTQQEFFIGSTSLVVHTPIGPVSVAANYYDQKDEPWSVLFHFGYIIFNRSPRD